MFLFRFLRKQALNQEKIESYISLAAGISTDWSFTEKDSLVCETKFEYDKSLSSIDSIKRFW